MTAFENEEHRYRAIAWLRAAEVECSLAAKCYGEHNDHEGQAADTL